MKHLEAVIFDMDGVIVDSEPLHEEAFLEVFHELGIGQNHGVDFTAYYGKSDRTLWVDVIERHRPPQPIEELLEWKQRRFLAMLRAKEPIFESLPELVERLARRYPLAVASGSPHVVIDAVLAMKNLRQYFSAFVSAQDVPRGKPAPDIFLRAAELLKKPAPACCVIEDSAAGVTGARAAGMVAIGITNSIPREKLAHASLVVDGYAEIDRLLL